MDLRLQSALEEDETLRRVGNRDFKDRANAWVVNSVVCSWMFNWNGCLIGKNWQLIAFDVSELSPGQCSRQTEDPKAQAALRLYQERAIAPSVHCWRLFGRAGMIRADRRCS